MRNFSVVASLLTISCLLSQAGTADDRMKCRLSNSSGTVSKNVRQHRQPGRLLICGFSGNSSLSELDARNGEVHEVGRLGEEATDLAVSCGRLYGLSFERFFEIDLSTGRAVAARHHGCSDLNALVAIPGDPTGFYAAGAEEDCPGAGAKFVRLDARTGAATLIGRLGAGLSSSGDLVYYNGTLYAALNQAGSSTTCWASINPRTGCASLISDTGVEDIWALDVRNGRIVGATGRGLILDIDHRTGACSITGGTGIVTGGMAVLP